LGLAETKLYLSNMPQTKITKIPKHVAIIMDGNGRWAKERHLPRLEGHRAGAKAVRAAVRASSRLGVEYLTLYAFSNENWSRPKIEINGLMQLLKFFLKKEVAELNKNNVKLFTIGKIEELPSSVQKELKIAKEKTSKNTGLKLILALNYGARREIVDAASKLVEDFKVRKTNGQQIDEKLFSSYLYTADYPDPDLLIRTSGEHRISNFLLWQISYAEIVVFDLYWPEFKEKSMEEAILEFQKRKRRFGGL